MGQVMPVVAGNKSSSWRACERKATRLEYCLRDNNYRPIDCVPEILDLKECCQIHEVSSFLVAYYQPERCHILSSFITVRQCSARCLCVSNCLKGMYSAWVR